MKFTETTHWDFTKENITGLLFFIQRIQELAHHKSNFLEKETNISIWEMLKEYKEILENIKEHETSQHYEKEIEIIYDEIVFNINDDDIIKSLLGDKKDKYISGLKFNLKNIDSCIHHLDLISFKINTYKYLEIFRTNIINILKNHKAKKTIKKYCDYYFKFLLYVGYQKGSISHLVNITFFNKDKSYNKINSNDNIFLLLNYFDLKVHEFEVCFRASNIFKEIENECNKFNIDVIDTFTAKYIPQTEKKFFKNQQKRQKTFLFCKSIKAMDYLHAVKIASQNITTLTNLIKVFYHRNIQWISDDCLVYYPSKKNVIAAYNENNFMLNTYDDIKTTQKILLPFLKSFSLKEDSFKRFKRAIDLHSLSIQSKETSNQILNLWICFESLLIVEKGKTHISIIEDALILITQNNYLCNIVRNLLKLIIEWDENKFNEIKSELPENISNNSLHSLIALITLKENQDIMNKLLKAMDNQPLLRFKIFTVINNLQDIKKIKNILKLHSQNIKNHIRRVYRVRNKIVHQGYLPKYDIFIVETAHYLIDELLDTIISKRINQVAFDSIQNFLVEEKLINQEHQHIINTNTDINKENFLKIIMGPDNYLK
ncbi:HEPN domain-containing protein [Aliarcobacter skirrowii]|uniref:HEPN domain-containing protein n=1 Tax=Aliarcobacter skirrowii TaxID=28200 RepID=UPI0029B9816A|nr:HEPN domain-containing protein [Aliarcobacter skirrowii]MDX4071602.1 HEPN domain-containing protein [Aliarcobacter skirrowii]